MSTSIRDKSNDNHIPSKIDNKAYVNVSQEQKKKRIINSKIEKRRRC